MTLASTCAEARLQSRHGFAVDEIAFLGLSETGGDLAKIGLLPFERAAILDGAAKDQRSIETISRRKSFDAFGQVGGNIEFVRHCRTISRCCRRNKIKITPIARIVYRAVVSRRSALRQTAS